MTRTCIGTATVAALVAALGIGNAHAQTVPPTDPAAGAPAPLDPTTSPPSPVDEPPTDTVTTTAEPAPAEPPAEEAKESEAEVGYDKGFVIAQKNEAGDFELKIQGRVELLLAGESNDTGADRVNTGAFSVARARLTLEGHMFTPKLLYKFQTDYGKGFITLKDFTIDGEVAKGIFVRAGQWKKPFSRQQITSSGRLELTTRAITDEEFRAGRDIGVAIHNNYEKSPDLEWAIGVFNGTGDKPVFSGTADPTTGAVTGGKFTNVPGKMLPAVVARVGINHGGIKGYSEADLEGGPLRYAAAVSVWGEGDLDGNDKSIQSAEADALVKVNGLSASAAVYFALLQDSSTGGEDSNLLGFHVQVGKVLGAGTNRIQPVARYALVKEKDVDATQEITLGFGWWPYGHNCKILANVGARSLDGAGFGKDLVGQLELATGFF